jgi:hypothetical protein
MLQELPTWREARVEVVRDGSGAIVGDGEGEHVSLVSGEPGAAAVAGEAKPSNWVRHGGALVQSR